MKKTILNLSIIFCFVLLLSTNVFAMNVGGFEISILNIIFIVILVILILSLSAVQRTKKINEKTKRTNQVLSQIVKKDATWDEKDLINNAKNTFYNIMNGLANKEFEQLKQIIHPNLYSKWKKQFSKFENCEPENLLNNEVKEVTIVDVNNFLDNEKDNYTVKIEYMASEYIVDKNGNLISDNYDAEAEKIALGQFTEYWKFERECNQWLVVEVNRSNKWKKYVNDKLVNEE